MDAGDLEGSAADLQEVREIGRGCFSEEWKGQRDCRAVVISGGRAVAWSASYTPTIRALFFLFQVLGLLYLHGSALFFLSPSKYWALLTQQ